MAGNWCSVILKLLFWYKFKVEMGQKIKRAETVMIRFEKVHRS